MRPSRLALALVVLGGAASAHAQVVDRRYAESPTDGVGLELAPRAGEHDARATTINAGGLALLRGPELALALDLQDTGVATSAGGGFGAYLATAVGGTLVPRLGLGMGLEWLRPPRAQLVPDPGLPFRFTLASALGLGKHLGFGVAWHHFHAEGALAGVDTYDLGLSARVGAYLAFGATLRDVATNPIANAPVQRRYELEVAVRPLATDRLELAAGGRVGETRRDVDAWGRVSVRATRGVFVHAGLESRELLALASDPITGVQEHDGRDVRATLGIELSFGSLGVLQSATGLRDDRHAQHALGAQTVLRVSGVGAASVLAPDDHIERVDLAGDIGPRDLTKLVLRLRAIGDDPTAKAVVVTFDGVGGGWATLEELRNELVVLRRDRGKKVFAYMVSGTGRDYFVASAAHKIYLDPAGGLRLVGMAGTSLYFRGTFDWLGVEPQFEKIAEYKSAPEQFTETGPTPPAAKMHAELYESLWQRWVAAVADGRHLDPQAVKAIVDAGPYTAGELASSGPAGKLVDAVAVPDKVAELVVAELGGNLPVDRPATPRPTRWARPGVAVIYLDGDITDGESKGIELFGQHVSGGQTLVRALIAARTDPDVKAIVLRIDSPGGSALASELISREVFATRGVKPIVCSFGNYAASGGYFAAAGCDAILAEPMTITGSIGIFFGKFDVSGLAKKLGVSIETFKRGKHADVESMFRPYTDEERALLLDKLRYSYGRFVGAVAEGRGLKKEDVDALGRGHVYTGEQALPLKLVDRYGGLADALALAKAKAGLAPGADVAVVELPDSSIGLLGEVGGLIDAHVAARHTDAVDALLELAGVRALVDAIPASVLLAPRAPQARLPFALSWD